jgi:prevent-host-death family protein
MSEVGAYEAKTHLPQLLERVAKGERFVITKHGRPVAELVPVSARDPVRIREAIAEVRKVRTGLARRGMRLKKLLRAGEALRDLMHEGHRF